MHKKLSVVSLVGLAAVTALSLTAMNQTEAKYTGTRKLTIQTDQINQLSTGYYAGVVPKTGYYVVQMRGGDGGSTSNAEGGVGGYVEALYKLNRGSTLELDVASDGQSGYRWTYCRGTNNRQQVYGGLGGDDLNIYTGAVAGGAGGGAAELFVDGTRYAAAGGGGGAAGGQAINGQGRGGSGGFMYEGATLPEKADGKHLLQIGDGFRGESGLSPVQNNYRGFGGYIDAPGVPGYTNYKDGYYSEAGGTASGANGGVSGSNSDITYSFENAVGGGGAGWFGGGGGNACKSYNSGDAAKYCGAGGGGSSNAINAVSTNLNGLFASIKTYKDVDLAAYRAGIPTTPQVGGGSYHAWFAKTQIYFVGATLPGDDKVGTGAIKLGS
ncbi:MAG: hypothetical protein LBT37_08205 [Lactobacillaceae bacterium]|jgi:hypothetical protein|nr:hypothetical protein [Lactobacillaceae bacterium]